MGPMDREHPVTRGLHVGFRARDRAQVDALLAGGRRRGYRDDGAPGPRTRYGPTYYGGFLLDPDGNSVEAVDGDRDDAVPDGWVDHLWIRVRDLQASAALLHDDRPARRAPPGARTSPAACSCPARTTASRSSATSGRQPSTSTSRSPRATTLRCARFTPPRSRRATRTTAGRASERSTTRATTGVRPRPGRAQRRGRQPQPGLSHADLLDERVGGRLWHAVLPPVTEDVQLDLIETRTFGSRVIYERYGRVASP